MEPEAKTLSLELKADAEGAFVATFATLNVVDHHGDVTVPGAFEPGKEVLIGGYQHDMMTLPVGKGVIRADEKRAWVEGNFFTDTQIGKDTYATVKNAGGLMEWSYIFNVLESSTGQFDTGDGKSQEVRYLKKLDVWSVDPVLKGAGIATRTDSIKSHSALTFLDHAEVLAKAVDEFVKRVRERADVRAKEGRTLSTANVDRLTAIAESLKSAAGDLEQLVTSTQPAPPKTIDILPEFVRFQRTLAGLNGIPL